MCVCALNFPDIYIARWSACEVSIVMIMDDYVCLYVCLSGRISLQPQARYLPKAYNVFVTLVRLY